MLFPRAQDRRCGARRPVDKLSIVLVAMFGVLLFGERLSAANWLGVGLCIAGIVLVVIRSEARDDSSD